MLSYFCLNKRSKLYKIMIIIIITLPYHVAYRLTVPTMELNLFLSWAAFSALTQVKPVMHMHNSDVQEKQQYLLFYIKDFATAPMISSTHHEYKFLWSKLDGMLTFKYQHRRSNWRPSFMWWCWPRLFGLLGASILNTWK